MENTMNCPACRGTGLLPGSHTQDVYQGAHSEASSPSQCVGRSPDGHCGTSAHRKDGAQRARVERPEN